MKLYKKIIKSVFIGIIFSMWFYALYEFVLKDLLRGRVIDFKMTTLMVFVLFLLLIFLVLSYHIRYFKVYDTVKVWEDTSVYCIILIIFII